MKFDVFISHSSKDSIIANQLCEYLEGNGINCWIAPRNVMAGLPYARAILQGIDDSTLMILLFSDNSNKSRHVESEVDRAFNKEKVIIPFRISDVAMSDVLSYYLGANHYIDGIPDLFFAFEELKSQIERILQKRLPKEIGVKGKYTILQNEKGEIMVMMDSREGQPENPRFIYDGSDTALLYRSPGCTVSFRNIDEGARESLRNVKEVLIVEVFNNDDVDQEYVAPVRIVRNVKNLIVE